MLGVEAAAFPERFDGQHQLVASAFVAKGVGEGDRAFPVLDHGDVGIGPDLQRSDVVGESHRSCGSGCSQRKRLVDRVAEMDIFRQRRHQVEHRPAYVVAVDVGRNRAGAKSLFETGFSDRERERAGTVANIEDDAPFHGVPGCVDDPVVVVENTVRMTRKRVRDDVAGTQLFEELLEMAYRPANVNHYRLVQLLPGFERPVECDQVVTTHDGFAKSDLDPDDHTGVQFCCLDGLLDTRPPDVFEFADFLVELAHARDMQEGENARVDFVDHVAVEAGNGVRPG